MRKLGIPLLLVLLFFLAGCSKAIPAEDAAKLFVDQVVYDKDAKKFTANFANGDELNKGFKENEKNFKDNFTAGLISVGDAVSEDEANELTELLNHQIKEVTSYKVAIKEAGKISNITYEVKGLDFAAIMKETSKGITQKIMADNKLASDQNKIIEETLQLLRENIKVAKAKEEAVPIMIEMKPEKGKWTIVRGQREQINNLYFAFVAGVKDQETLTNDWNKAMEEVAKEVQAELK
ncbi:hypothetical protein EsVE80_25260 [Enterococcus saigonensis]|uniref:DUF5105 domain-containing protein n=1 Tax=Enterococcus saigonensis TaxID=1805431 RepID=A0A679IFT5_9ENTE|nr:DUF5105 domain-containing protein [Enterococcus saigonensis]BCA87003.1 hypothetical protein EsVE80_25260 [Enterococcus saigonensis]